MPIFTFSTLKIYKQHFFTMFDHKGKLLKISIGLLFLLYIYCVVFPVPNEYINILKNYGKFQSIDNLFDYAVPLLAALVIFYAFLPDYKEKIYVFFQFYTDKTYSSMMICRWLTFVVTFSIGVLFSHMMYFRNVAFLDVQSVWMALAKLPNLFMLCAVVLFFMHQFKNAYIGLFVMLAYYVFDYISAGRTLAYLSLGAHSNNFYYQYSPTLYIVNRIVLVVVSIILLLLTCRKHPLINITKWFRR
ncbi:hypothetical protein AU377_13270 [Sporosarcina sp. HYO08]|nr:hypothetical protein AU377_13270 [Sporosarcina sp. HYO08]